MGDDDFGGLDPAVELDGVRVFQGDCRDVLAKLPADSVDSIVTDPPYELGFMGKKWDSSGIAYDVKVWAECLRVLKPGGHILAFGGSRTWHRLAVAIEDAGFEIRDNIAWIYGSGFPKSLDVSKAIDKSDAKVERRARDLRFTAWMRSTGITAKKINELTGSNMGSHYLTDKEQPTVPTEDMFSLLRPHLPDVPEDIERLVFARTVESKNFAEREVIGQGKSGKTAIWNDAGEMGNFDLTKSATSEAKIWEGWGTALKPAHEPVVVGRKPLGGKTVAENVLLWGVGGLNIDGSRIYVGENDKGGFRSGTYFSKNDSQSSWEHRENGDAYTKEQHPQGRWPANVILDEVTAGLLDEQSGVSKSGKPGVRSADGFNAGVYGKGMGIAAGNANGEYGDTGGASRFFYVAKASKRDRNEGLEDLEDKRVGTFEGSVEQKPGRKIGRNRNKPNLPGKNTHPTVKPTALMRYLVKLVTPPGGTVLDPFTGSGSTGKAAILEGFEFVGVELTEDYLPIIEGRLNWALENRDEGALF